MNAPVDINPDYALPNTVLLQHGRWRLYLEEGVNQDRWKAFLAAVEHLFSDCVAQVEETWPLPEGTEAHVVLAERSVCDAWGLDGDVLGFHGMCATIHNEEGLSWELPDDHRCYLNLEAWEDALSSSTGERHSRLSVLSALPYEMGRLALFVHHAKGQTPLQVFDRGGESALHAVTRLVEEDTGMLADLEEGAMDDAVEELAERTVGRWARAHPQAAALMEALPKTPPVTKRRWWR